MDREEALKEAGVQLTAVSEIETLLVAFSNSDAFSGYGEFTPITVRSDTVLADADMERNKHRDR